MNTKELLAFFEGVEKKISTELEAARAEIKKLHDQNIKNLFAQKRKELEEGLKEFEAKAKADMETALTTFSQVATKVYDSVIPAKATPAVVPTPETLVATEVPASPATSAPAPAS